MCKLNRTSAYYKDLKKGPTKHTLILMNSIHFVFNQYMGMGDNNFTASMQK